ncbi:S8 family serine peptidase [Streptomyces roseicoloratus]|uniref:S8 family serine peptidase n=1 Tax=Streptomyces roseicoloratus TaxID=2508722 RepID=UPI001009D015|nr:S8 family serine peptidase [Streptomyces roseicoloratus]
MRRRTPLFVCALAVAAATVVPAQAAGAADPPVALPGMPERLAPDQKCTSFAGRPLADAPWTRRALGLDQVWQLSQGQGVTVAVVATGVSETVSVLKGRVRALGDARGDCVGRGSFLAGIAAGATAPGQGFSGVAPQARILAVRGTGTRGEADPGRMADGVRAAAQGGADVIVAGAPLDGADPRVRSAMAAAARADALVVVPAAADGGGAAPPAPAPPPQALAVVATGPDGALADRAPGFTRADLSAPGVALVGPGPHGDGKWTGSGASLAASVTAGTAALVRAYHPELDARQVRERLLRTAYPGDLPALDPYGAVAGSAPEAGPAPAVETRAVRLRGADATGAAARTAALLVAVGSAGAVLAVAFLAAVVPRGRRRGWRAGRFGDQAAGGS